ncbi:MAG: ORF6N domain-containing protein, partial [Bacteroidetes bacterium]|nr:ORF6N domain-containing protein [Bacteroidota bacterium]
MKFADLNERFLEDFKEHLLTTKSNRSDKTTLSVNSAVSYFNKIKAALKQAYKDGILQADLNAKVQSIKAAETRREYLTIEELNRLVKTPCNNDLLKRAALFLALTGLRFSDIQKMVWGELEYIEGQGYFLNFSQKKTKGVEVLPISEQAYNFCGTPGEPTTKVFEGLEYSAMQLQTIQNRIYEIRGQKIMLDFDLAEMYEVETKVLKQAIRRNSDLFPDDFMFELTRSEVKTLTDSIKSQTVTFTWPSITYTPFAFTEHGVVMLANVLKSKKARQTSIVIVRAFIALKQFVLNYNEFLNAVGENDLADLIREGDWKLITAFKSRFIERLRQYYYVGGMPEAVAAFAENNDYNEVREIQLNILQTYENDFSKHAPADIVPRIRMLWKSIPAQLSKENRKFIYGLIRTGSRAKDYEVALMWLEDCGLVHKICRITKPAIPLKLYEDSRAFKLFLVDIGLLGAMNKIDSSVLLYGNKLFREFKGSMTEQYVMQQLIINQKFQINYWSSEHSDGEVDFVVQTPADILAVEVKAEENLKAKSLRAFIQKYGLNNAVRISMSDYREEAWLTNLPLYGIDSLF